MSPFEQQVAEALAVAMGCKDMADAKRTYPDEGATVWDHAVEVSPRVAAAIEAAAAQASDDEPTSALLWRSRYRGAALEALGRGGEGGAGGIGS